MGISIRDILVCLSLWPAAAYAVLGQSESSVERDHAALKAQSVSDASTDLYRVHTLSASGTTVREYATTDGTIFAVTWSGQTRPDLTVLLGPSYQEYRRERDKAAKPKGRQHVPVNTSSLVVRHSGHMGAIRGQAYLPNLVPTGVAPEDLP